MVKSTRDVVYALRSHTHSLLRLLSLYPGTQSDCIAAKSDFKNSKHSRTSYRCPPLRNASFINVTSTVFFFFFFFLPLMSLFYYIYCYRRDSSCGITIYTYTYTFIEVYLLIMMSYYSIHIYRVHTG